MEPGLGSVPRDARMLVLFDEIYRTHSMTRAAERLDLSQPTASIWLSKLRRAWHDPLFVRTSAGMQPTPRADALIGPAREALSLLRRLSGDEPVFDPAAAHRNFRICMTDASHITLLPRILAHVRGVGPEVRLDVANISAGTAHMLETGEADIALGYIPGLEAGFHEQRLYTQDFICLVSAQHPRIGAVFTARAYKEEAHIGILSSTSYPMLQNSLRSQGIERRVQLELPGFLGLGAIVSSTDLIATVPRTIGEALARMGPMKVFACPVKVPTFTVKQYWHARYHHDPGVRWLRGVCAQLLGRNEPPRARAQPRK
ncbi:MAG: LysR family transcriptional regulator [Aromatoleum sp.]|nr:LysR family transcriptional regulator [Aromatoleum sp.]